MTDFWKSIPAPFFALAPMEDVTDTVFREVVMSVSEPGILKVVFTEFTSTDGLCSERGRHKVIQRLVVNESELTILRNKGVKLVAQVWGDDPEKFRDSARLIHQLGVFDGIDINMGCPVNKVVKHRSCSDLINHPRLAAEIIQASKEASPLPVSVKTRLGFNQIITEEWTGHLLECHPSAITLHGRTRKMMSEGPALWNEIAKAVQLRDAMGSETLILGNGDVSSYPDGLARISASGVDGAMVGRGIFRDPWMFSSTEQHITVLQRLELLRRHIMLYRQSWGNRKDYNILKRFYKIYLNGFPGAAHWRDQLMRAPGYEEALEVIGQIEALQDMGQYAPITESA